MITVQNFMMRLDARFDGLGEGPNRNDIATFLGRFPVSKIEQLWDAFIERYSYNRIPRVADIAKAGREVGLFPGSREKKTAWYVCLNCGNAYTLGSRGCPVCRAETPVTVKIHQLPPDDLIPVRTDCFRCRVYGSSLANGPTCQFYAEVEKAMTPEDSKKCTDCVCRDCCREERCLKFDEREFRRRAMQQRNGDLPDVMGKLIEKCSVKTRYQNSKIQERGEEA